jgi:hypothetical protein
VYDWLFFLLPPVLALVLGIAIADTPLTRQAIYIPLFGNVTAAGIAIAVFIHAHLVIVFFRSHGNEGIAQLYPFRFLVAPILLYTAMVWSMWAIITISVISTLWDVYHSGLQTFGFSRIYDRKVGNHPEAGRRLDWWLNHLLYAGPILAGVTMMDHAEEFNAFHEVGATFFTAIPAYMEGNQRYFTWAVLALGSAFLAYYLFAQWRFHRQGHPVSWLKVYLLTSTGLTSIYTWGFNSFGEAFFIMNFFHALQYFGIVWATEKRNMMRMFRVENLRLGKPITLLVFLGVAVAYGCFVEWMDTSLQWLWAATIVVSIMHFWYDGFIWSVSKQQV